MLNFLSLKFRCDFHNATFINAIHESTMFSTFKIVFDCP